MANKINSYKGKLTVEDKYKNIDIKFITKKISIIFLPVGNFIMVHYSGFVLRLFGTSTTAALSLSVLVCASRI